MTISLNIGGTKPVVTGAVKDTKTAISKTGAATSSAPASGTTTPTKSATKTQPSVSKAAASAAASKEAQDRKEALATKDFNFTMDRSKNDADTIAKEQAIVADDQTLKELYGEEEDVVDTNGLLQTSITLCSEVPLKLLQKKCT